MRLLRSLIFLTTLYLCGCSHLNLSEYATAEISEVKSSTADSNPINELNYHGIPLRSGQILVSSKDTGLNLFLTLTDEAFHPFAHAGIISIENNRPYLYHATADLKLLYQGTLTEKTRGTIERLPLSEYLNKTTVSAIYSHASAKQEQLMADFAIKAHKQKLPYDAFFDETDRSKVYCSEFIVAAIESSGGLPVKLRKRRQHPSINAIYEGLAIKTNHHYFANDLITHANRIGLFSKTLNKEQISIYFELRKEIHRRFTDDQKAGNIIQWTGFGLEQREPIKLFIKKGLSKDFRDRQASESLTEWVAALANDVFGEFDG